MNGRLYDPLLGRMLSPDPHIQSPGYTQNYNRYSYVFNNPLKYTDPDGEWVLQALGSIARMYIDGSLANGFEFNPLNWNWKSADTWTALYNGYQAGKTLGSQWEANYNRLFGGKSNALTEVPGANYMNAYSLLHGMAADGGNGWDPTQATEPVGYTTEYMNLIGEVSVNPENAAGWNDGTPLIGISWDFNATFVAWGIGFEYGQIYSMDGKIAKEFVTHSFEVGLEASAGMNIFIIVPGPNFKLSHLEGFGRDLAANIGPVGLEWSWNDPTQSASDVFLQNSTYDTFKIGVGFGFGGHSSISEDTKFVNFASKIDWKNISRNQRIWGR